MDQLLFLPPHPGDSAGAAFTDFEETPYEKSKKVYR